MLVIQRPATAPPPLYVVHQEPARERVLVRDDRDKLRFMRAKATAGARARMIVALASRLTRPFAADDYRARADALFRFVRDGVRYQRDPARREQIADAEVTLERGYGDCDDKAILFAALAGAVGLEADVWPLWKGDFLAHVQEAVRWPGSERVPGARAGSDTLDGPPGAGWLVSDATIAGAALGQDPRTVAVNPETGKLPLA